MNHTLDDNGRTVISVGAPGSIERMRCERPALISRLNNLYWSARDASSPGAAVDEAVQMIREAGVKDYRETNAILASSDYSLESSGSVTALVMAVGETTP